MKNDSFYKELLLKEKELLFQQRNISKALDGIRSLLEFYTVKDGSEKRDSKKQTEATPNKDSASKSFKDLKSYGEKVEWIIFDLKEAPTSVVRKKWSDLDNELGDDIISRETRRQLWKLEEKGKIKSKPMGDGHKKIYYVEQ